MQSVLRSASVTLLLTNPVLATSVADAAAPETQSPLFNPWINGVSAGEPRMQLQRYDNDSAWAGIMREKMPANRITLITMTVASGTCPIFVQIGIMISVTSIQAVAGPVAMPGDQTHGAFGAIAHRKPTHLPARQSEPLSGPNGLQLTIHDRLNALQSMQRPRQGRQIGSYH